MHWDYVNIFSLCNLLACDILLRSNKVSLALLQSKNRYLMAIAVLHWAIVRIQYTTHEILSSSRRCHARLSTRCPSQCMQTMSKWLWRRCRTQLLAGAFCLHLLVVVFKQVVGPDELSYIESNVIKCKVHHSSSVLPFPKQNRPQET